MGAGQSDLYKGTYGDNIDNIPDEARPESKGGEVKNGEVPTTDNLNLTDAQRSTVKTLNNTIRNHLTEEDFSGTKLELEGKPIVGKLGTPFQHLYEMKTSHKTLLKAIKSLEGSLENPYLGESERHLLQNSLDLASKYLDRIVKLLMEFGEL